MTSDQPTTSRWLMLAALVLLGAFAANPLFDPRLPEAHDVRFHLYRLVQLDSLVRQGVLFSRWAPELAYGYGYPIFNYYAPSVYYVAEVFHLLGFPFTVALRLTFALALICMVLGMYAWVRELFDPLAAFVAAAAYVAAPYTTILLLHRGALAELMALALLPFILWMTHRFVGRGRPLHGVLGAALYALLILTHNITALLFTVVLLGYGACLVLVSWSRTAERTWDVDVVRWVGLRLLFILGFGLGLAAFFWLPALAERDLVHIDQLYLPEALRFQQHFAELSDILGVPSPADPRLTYQLRPMSRLHLIAVALALLALLSIWRLRGRRFQKVVTLFACLGWGVSVFMTLPVSEGIWLRLPLLPFIQFPWRFIGLGSLFVATLAGAALYSWRDRLLKGRGGWLLVWALIMGLALYVVPWQYVRRYPPMRDLNMEDSVRFERQTGSLGTTTTGEFLPVTVQALPEADSRAVFNDGERLASASLPEGAEVLQEVYGPTHYEVLLESPEAFTAVFDTFNFSGWRAAVDGERVSITATEPHGLISVDVPAGRHRLVVWFGSTPVRVWAAGVSIVSVVGLISVAMLGGWPRKSVGWVTEREPIPAWIAYSVLTAVICALVFKLAYVDREGQQTLLRRTRFDGTSVMGVGTPLTVNFDDQLHLLGMDAPAQVASGERLEITLYWRVPVTVDKEYSVGLVLVDERGVRYGQSDHQHPGGYPPTTQWRPEEYAQDTHHVSMLPGSPPGRYRLEVSVYPYGQPEQALDVLNAQGAPVGHRATLIPITVTRPQQVPSRVQLAPERSLERPLTGGVKLIGYDVPDGPRSAGGLLPLTFYWEALSETEVDLEIEIALRDKNGDATPLATVPPVPGYPMSRWEAGDRWRGVHRLLLPPTLTSGEYQIVLGGSTMDAFALDAVVVQAPEHIMERPPVERAQSATFGDLVSLVGYDVSPSGPVEPGDVLTIRLVWEVHRQTRSSYKTFVHLLEVEGRRVAGSDQIPAGWQRPTTGWVGGEYIVDMHTFNVPSDLSAGIYRLQTGLYREDTGERLLRSNDADTFVFELEVEVVGAP